MFKGCTANVRDAEDVNELRPFSGRREWTRDRGGRRVGSPVRGRGGDGGAAAAAPPGALRVLEDQAEGEREELQSVCSCTTEGEGAVGGGEGEGDLMGAIQEENRAAGAANKAPQAASGGSSTAATAGDGVPFHGSPASSGGVQMDLHGLLTAVNPPPGNNCIPGAMPSSPHDKRHASSHGKEVDRHFRQYHQEVEKEKEMDQRRRKQRVTAGRSLHPSPRREKEKKKEDAGSMGRGVGGPVGSATKKHKVLHIQERHHPEYCHLRPLWRCTSEDSSIMEDPGGGGGGGEAFRALEGGGGAEEALGVESSGADESNAGCRGGGRGQKSSASGLISRGDEGEGRFSPTSVTGGRFPPQIPPPHSDFPSLPPTSVRPSLQGPTASRHSLTGRVSSGGRGGRPQAQVGRTFHPLPPILARSAEPDDDPLTPGGPSDSDAVSSLPRGDVISLATPTESPNQADKRSPAATPSASAAAGRGGCTPTGGFTLQQQQQQRGERGAAVPPKPICSSEDPPPPPVPATSVRGSSNSHMNGKSDENGGREGHVPHEAWGSGGGGLEVEGGSFVGGARAGGLGGGRQGSRRQDRHANRAARFFARFFSCARDPTASGDRRSNCEPKRQMSMDGPRGREKG
uniref:Uncharacterized protein n=1 Tax=Chromera velia CCMP2878 TaxID=1169474 RepID=A0A0G4I7R7_9ALVE|eukprot:Cvel_11734.t1-p1 / transcript=Cvel_11734.t1 / gene=Cvel_11734 / organism=Chromera_velia_CCMP2878 / gene_product=hypothetical protein / transcript_product=hypothetical protein / location=Cvel_scaffold745:40912-43341(+) / protein_length=628 / sequence_SO=supercontig / SO=protein_coding / is_pseudo=false